MGAVDARVAPGQRRVVGVADELDGHVLLVAQVVQDSQQLLPVLRRHRQTVLFVVERRNQVLHPRALRVARLVADPAHLLDAADLDAFDVLLHRHLLGDQLLVNLVVPDLDFHAAVPGTPRLRRVGGDGRTLAHAFVGDRLGRERERLLEELRRHAGALARQAGVVSKLPLELAHELHVVGVAHEVQANVFAALHVGEDLAHLLDIVVRDVDLARCKVDRWQQVLHLDRPHRLVQHLLFLGALLDQRRQAALVLRPWRQRCIGRDLLFDSLSEQRRGHHLRPAWIDGRVRACAHLRQRHDGQQHHQPERDVKD